MALNRFNLVNLALKRDELGLYRFNYVLNRGKLGLNRFSLVSLALKSGELGLNRLNLVLNRGKLG